MSFRVSKLYLLAREYSQRAVEDQEIIKINATEDFWKEIDAILENGERGMIEIHGPTRSAKSTSGIAVALRMHQMMKEKSRYSIFRDFNMHNIARDQSERNKRLMNPKFNHTVLVTDEDNELEKTGANATSNQALQKTMSDIHAGRYVHEIMISPRDFIDPNTQIILNTVPGGVDKDRKMVFLKLYYRFWEGVEDHTQLLGYVELYVGDLIETWITRSQKLFFTPEPDIENFEGHEDPKYIAYCKKYIKIQEELQELIKKDFYTEYQVKKYEKMDMLTKEGIFRPRMLDISEVILKVYNSLKIIADSSSLTKRMVKNHVKLEMRKAKIVNSVLGEDLATEEAFAILETLKGIRKLEKESRKKPELRETLMQKVLILKEALDMQIDELKLYKKINDRYNN